jgi:hypothetical protein
MQQVMRPPRVPHCLPPSRNSSSPHPASTRVAPRLRPRDSCRPFSAPGRPRLDPPPLHSSTSPPPPATVAHGATIEGWPRRVTAGSGTTCPSRTPSIAPARCPHSSPLHPPHLRWRAASILRRMASVQSIWTRVTPSSPQPRPISRSSNPTTCCLQHLLPMRTLDLACLQRLQKPLIRSTLLTWVVVYELGSAGWVRLPAGVRCRALSHRTRQVPLTQEALQEVAVLAIEATHPRRHHFATTETTGMCMMRMMRSTLPPR